jgi:hypothetical protein
VDAEVDAEVDADINAHKDADENAHVDLSFFIALATTDAFIISSAVMDGALVGILGTVIIQGEIIDAVNAFLNAALDAAKDAALDATNDASMI